MPRSVRVICQDCGGVSVPEGHIQLYVCQSRPELSHYTFRCTSCNTDRVREASTREVQMLMGYGFTAYAYEPDAELFDPARRNPLPLTEDDYLDLILDINAWGVLDHE